MNGTGFARRNSAATCEQRRRADAVDVVVAVDEHRFGITRGADESLDGNGRVRQTVRRVQSLQPRAKEVLRGLDRPSTRGRAKADRRSLADAAPRRAPRQRSDQAPAEKPNAA